MRNLLCGMLLMGFGSVAMAQRVAVIVPDQTAAGETVAEALAHEFPRPLSALDHSLVNAAYSAVRPAAPFNMTRDEARRIASAIGCDAIVLVRSATLRRSSSTRPEYYESYAFVYLISGRTGRLVLWKPLRYDAPTAELSAGQLMAAIKGLASDAGTSLAAAREREVAEPLPSPIEEVPLTAPAASERFRHPVPYRRIKPAYTPEAAYYDIAATVEIAVDLSADGKVLRTEIERWAGFGLDESVERTVRAMNWRPAERHGKAIPMRFVLRYNFADIDNDGR